MADDTPTTKFPLDVDEPTEPVEQDEPDDATAGSADGDTSKVSGWGRVLRGNRTLWIVAASAVFSLVAGLLVGHFLIGPADSKKTPAPGLVTAPVEFGPLRNDVTLRADVGYADAVEVTVDASAIEGRAIVTGQVPAVGATFSALSIGLELAGRPVIVLPGELPSYRTLRFGVAGPDVLQLKQALVSIGLNPGDAASARFDEATANAVAQLYAAVGYELPSAGEEAATMVATAEEGVRTANEGLAQAQAALAAAGAGPSELEAWQADVQVATAEKALADAKAGVEDGSSVQQAEWDLQTARLQRDQLWAAKNTSSESAAVESAKAQVDTANKALEAARQDALPFLPPSEVLYLTELPRRVDAVNVKRGDTLSGSAMTVWGATVRLTGAAAEADAGLLKVGGEGTFELPDGTEHKAVVSAVTPGKDTKARWQVLLDPAPLTPEQVTLLQGSNVAIKISVGATDGDVLSVPLAALTAGPGGESRVEVVESDPREGEDAETRTVVVKTGLAARGAVEITPVKGKLEDGDLVVVGR